MMDPNIFRLFDLHGKVFEKPSAGNTSGLTKEN